MTGKHVAAAVLAIVLATAVLPPWAAWMVNRRRVARAGREVSALARQLQAHEVELGRMPAGSRVLCGSGGFPAAAGPELERWATAPRARFAEAVPGLNVPADSWGNCYVLNLESREGASAPVWILSAGPNGQIETAFGAAELAGDDVGARVR